MSNPKPTLHPGPWWSFVPHTLYLFLRMFPNFAIHLSIFSNLLNSKSMEFHFQRDEVVEGLDFILIFSLLVIAYGGSFILGYTSVVFPTIDEESRENIPGCCMVMKLRVLLMRRLSTTDISSMDTKREFAEYLADPYRSFSRFARGQTAVDMSSSVTLSLCFARLPLREWSKIQDGFPASLDTLFQGLGGIVVIFWGAYLMFPLAWEDGWVLRMGSLARQIWRGCFKAGNVKESEGDT